jgi:hypothetical protein
VSRKNPEQISRGFPAGSRVNTGLVDISGFVNHLPDTQSIKISSKVDEATRNGLRTLVAETHQDVSGRLTEAIRDYVTRKRGRPEALNHLEQPTPRTSDRERCLPGDSAACLSRHAVPAIHSTLLECFAGPADVRDCGLLESAQHRPWTGHFAELAEMAVALLVSLIASSSATEQCVSRSSQPIYSCA